MDVERLQEKVAAAEAKVEKLSNTIVRHRAQLDKRVAKAINLGCPVARGDDEFLKNYWSFYDRSGFSREQEWAIFDIHSKLDDLKGAMRKYDDAQASLRSYQSKLSEALEVERAIEENCPAVIKDFLELWKNNCTDYYQRKYGEWPEFAQELQKAERDAKITCLRGVAEVGAAQFVADTNLAHELWKRSSIYAPEISDDAKTARLQKFTEEYTKDWERYCEGKDDYYLRNVYPHQLMDAYLKSQGLDHNGIAAKRREFGGDLLLTMLEKGGESNAFAYLDRALEAEKKAKIIDLMNRIERVVGRIIDATDLHIGPKGDLEGIIFGDSGKAKINTIGAGGYNIQCFHFRTLIHEYKEKGEALSDVLSSAYERSQEKHNDSQSKDELDLC